MGYARYEDDPRYETERIPFWFIEAIMPMIVNRGSPPVTFEELIAISEANNIGQLASMYSDE